MTGLLHMDAAQSAFAYRELQAVETKVLETEFPPLLSAQLVPYVTDIPRGAMSWGFHRITPGGMARLIAADVNDLPKVAVEKTFVSFPVHSFGIAHGYTWEDMEAAKMTGFGLDAVFGKACRDGVMAKLDEWILKGDSTLGITGFINDASVPVGNATYGTWSSATAAHIIDDLNESLQDVRTTTKRLYVPDTIVLPPAAYAKIATTPYSTNSDMTILKFWLANNQFAGNVQIFELDDLATAGVGNTPRMIMYKRSPDVLQAKIAIMPEPQPAQHTGTRIETPWWARWGGTVFRVPIAANYVDNL